MHKPKNLKEAVELIKKYESITLDQIYASIFNFVGAGNPRAENLTGFGRSSTCPLCKPLIEDDDEIFLNCIDCVHYDENIGKSSHYCMEGEAYETYADIRHARTSENLFNAFKERAKYLKQLIKKWENG